MQLGNLLPHLLDNFLTVTDLIDVVADPDFDPTQMGLPAEKLERFRNRMLLRMHERSAADWMSDFVDNGGVAATLYQTTAAGAGRCGHHGQWPCRGVVGRGQATGTRRAPWPNAGTAGRAVRERYRPGGPVAGDST